MKGLKKDSFVFKVICTILIWCLTVCVMFLVFREKADPLYMQEGINEIPEGNLLLRPQDTFRQTFEINMDNLEGVTLAFDYDDAVRDTGTLTVRFYCDDVVIMEQPLPFFACPQATFLGFELSSFEGDSLTVEVQNTSENADCVLSILDTSNFYKYLNYSKGYQINGGATVDGSILCEFRYRAGYDYYKGLTYAFYVFIAAIILTRFLGWGFAWLQQRICH